jgi:asparagine synthase (glutamine-hydrolysing)
MARGCWRLAYNGEIYNYVELRSELEAQGEVFRSSGDTEVLLALLAREGERALPRLVGMFALALLNIDERRVLLARDPFGIKPLYVTERSGALAFASEIKALLALPGVEAVASPARLGQYLRFGATDYGEETLFAGIGQIPAGGYRWVDLDRPGAGETRRYWTPVARPREIGFDEAAQRLRELFLDSVRLHLRSDVPVGCCLSGGVDSSAIACAMRQAAGERLELHAFSHIASDPALSEERWIDIVAGATGAVSHRVRPSAADLAADLDELVRVQEEPFGSTSIYAQRRVFRLAREVGVKVVLDGQGADEMLAGYDYYLGARVAELLRKARFGDARAFMRRAEALRGVPARAQLMWALDRLLPEPLNGWARRRIGKELAPSWMNEEWLSARGGRMAAALSGATLAEVLVSTLRGPGLPALLRYEDRNSMAVSIESRVPFLTPAIAEFCLSLPADFLIGPDGNSKRVFREAMRGIVPDAILDRRDKIGFATPEAEWLSTVAPWVEAQFASEEARAIPALRLDRAVAEWQAIRDGARRYNPSVWRWINLIAWTRRWNVRYD